MRWPESRGGRALAEYAVFLALYVPVAVVLGWGFAGFVLVAAYFGFCVGKGYEGAQAHRRGLVQGAAIFQLVQLTVLEERAAAELGPSDPKRAEIAAERARLMKAAGIKPDDIEIKREAA